MKRNIFSWLLFVVGVFSVPVSVASENELVLQMQSGNAVLMIRHALAPGIGDPEEFDINDCNTQRNLDNAGREQAQAIGQWLRDHGIKNVKLFSSQWCRCMDTARLMGMGEVTPLPALNSFFESPQDREPNLSALRKFIHNKSKPGELIIMVTHQVTISGITGNWTDSGHGKLVRPGNDGKIKLLGELDFND
ncbi:MAG: histidine phosphatase family protein [Arenicellales bacterium]